MLGKKVELFLAAPYHKLFFRTHILYAINRSSTSLPQVNK